MKIYYLGFPPPSFPFDLDWRKWGGGPIYEFDALVVFNEDRPLRAEDIGKARLAVSHGRPIHYFGPSPAPGDLNPSVATPHFEPGLVDKYVQQLAEFPRTNYQPIDCNFYDNFEAAIVERRPVRLVFREVAGEESRIETRLLDTKTHLSEEYVQFRDGTWLRLDRVVSVDGVAAGESCRF